MREVLEHGLHRRLPAAGRARDRLRRQAPPGRLEGSRVRLGRAQGVPRRDRARRGRSCSSRSSTSRSSRPRTKMGDIAGELSGHRGQIKGTDTPRPGTGADHGAGAALGARAFPGAPEVAHRRPRLATAWSSATTSRRRRSCSRSSSRRTSRKPKRSSRMHFVRAGRGAPPLVFVHGFACSHEDWRSQLDFFSQDQRSHRVRSARPRRDAGPPARVLDRALRRRRRRARQSPRAERLHPDRPQHGLRVVLEANRLVPERVAGIVLVDGSR